MSVISKGILGVKINVTQFAGVLYSPTEMIGFHMFCHVIALAAFELTDAALDQGCYSKFGSNKERKKDCRRGKKTAGKDLEKARKRLS